MQNDPGRFVWFDLTTTDAKAAKTFYRTIAGWETTSGGPGYDLFTQGGRPVAGLREPGPDECSEAGPFWMGHVAVADADAAAERARRLGGQVVMGPGDIPGVGRFALLLDPQGAAITAFAPAGAPPPGEDGCAGADAGPGHFGWSELRAKDAQAAIGIYGELFGWRAGRSIEPAGGAYQFLTTADGAEVAGLRDLQANEGDRPHWYHYLQVADLDVAAKQVPALGGRVLAGPVPVPGGGRCALCLDPQGAPFGIYA